MKPEALPNAIVEAQDDHVLIGGLVAYAAHQADQLGQAGLSNKLEEIFIDIANLLPAAARRTLLLMSHEIALNDAPPERVRLYLVKS
jgi:hypothetical protein